MNLSDLVYSSSAFDLNSSLNQDFISIPFCHQGNLMTNSFDFPLCNLTLKATGSMRFRWNEHNQNRTNYCKKYFSSKRTVPLELIHSKVVFAVDLDKDDNLILLESYGNSDLKEDLKKADGILTCNPKIVPLLTVADCLPIYLFDPVTKVFSLVHSGWKGTGIAINAIELAKKIYKANAKDFCVVIGPHIHNCCYKVDLDRGNYFFDTYGKDCVSTVEENKMALSLVDANIKLLLDAGVSINNILHCTDCTSCDSRFGSFRRETSSLSENITLEERQLRFTPMVASMTFNN